MKRLNELITPLPILVAAVIVACFLLSCKITHLENRVVALEEYVLQVAREPREAIHRLQGTNAETFDLNAMGR